MDAVSTHFDEQIFTKYHDFPKVNEIADRHAQ